MFKNITQYIRHNLKTGKSIIILLTVVMLICGPLPLFIEFSDRLDTFEYRNGIEKVEYARIIERNLISTFDMDGGYYYHIFISLIAAVAGLVLAYVLFFHFRKKNSSDFFLSLPITRTETYIANFATGILYYVIPLLFTSLVSIIGLNIMGSWKFVNIAKLLFITEEHTGMLAMLGTNLTFFLLFFAIGTVSVILTSNGINSLVVYGTINFYPIVFMFLLLMSAEIFNNDIIDFAEAIMMDLVPITPIVRVLSYSLLAPTAWTYVTAIIAAVLIGGIGCWLCNIRPAESWSSAIVFKPLRLCLQYMYCFIVAFAGGLFLYAISDRSLINIIIGSVIGLVVSFMLLNIIFERDVKALFKKPMRLVWSAVIFIAVFAVIVMDAFGIFRYREPDPASIDYVEVSLNHDIITNNYSYSATDAGLSRLESEEEKAAAIKLYSILHENIRANNYSYLFAFNTEIDEDSDYFNTQLDRFYTNRIIVKMMKDGKDIRPLRSNYFSKTEEMYDLYKTIYDSPDYTDPIITVLENASLVYVQPSTTFLVGENKPSKLSIAGNAEVLEELRLALIEDYKNITFDELQDTSIFTIELMYNIDVQAYEKEITAIQSQATAQIYDTSMYPVEYERSMQITLPLSFNNTFEILNKLIDLEELERKSMETKIASKIEVIICSKDGVERTEEITDQEQINRILADSIIINSRSTAFPKYGVIIKVWPENLDLYYSKEYIEKYEGALEDLQRSVLETYFLKRTSTLY